MHVNYTVLSVRRTADTRTQVQMRSHSNNTQLWKRAYHHSCLTQHPATHSPSPFCVLHPLCVVLFSVDGSTKGNRMQISTKMTNYHTADRLKSWPFICYTAHSNCLQMPSISLPTHNHKHAPPFGIPFPPLVSQVIRIRVHAYVFVCCRRLPYFLGLFLISPRAFKIWPGQMGKGVWPTLMDSRPIKRMSMLSKARGPCIPGCVLVCAYKRQEKKIVFMCQYANKHSSSTLLLTV